MSEQTESTGDIEVGCLVCLCLCVICESGVFVCALSVRVVWCVCDREEKGNNYRKHQFKNASFSVATYGAYALKHTSISFSYVRITWHLHICMYVCMHVLINTLRLGSCSADNLHILKVASDFLNEENYHLRTLQRRLGLDVPLRNGKLRIKRVFRNSTPFETPLLYLTLASFVR